MAGMDETAADLDGEEDELFSRHKEEMKSLRATIQALKKSVPKGDKRKKKEVNDEISRLEKEMSEKHAREKEMSSNSKKQGDTTNGELSEKLSTVTIQSVPKTEKKTKAQKRREKREREEQEMKKRIEEATANTGPSLKEIEQGKLISQLKSFNFGIKEINPDGHCLYAAIGDQLNTRFNLKLSVEELRKRCSDYMRSNTMDFMPFAVDHETGDPCDKDTFNKYCDDVEKTVVWGGHLEIRALSHVFSVAINVFQADLPVFCIGEEYREKGILHLSYHHHAYGLGEHYNSIVPLSK